MLDYILQFTTGEKFTINKDEAMAIAKAGENQSVTITRLGMVVQKRMVSVYPQGANEENKHSLGKLHDGCLVKRKFGEWVSYETEARIDPHYYPEVARDCVPSVDTFERELRQLEPKARLEKLLGQADDRRINTGGFTQIGEIKK